MNHLLPVFPARHPFITLIFAIAAIFIAIKILRTTFRLALIASIIGLILIVFFGYTPKDVFNQGEKIASLSTSYVRDTIKPLFDGSLKNTHIKRGTNGTLEISGDQFEIGETPNGEFILHIKPLNLTLSREEISNYLGKADMQKLLQTLRDQSQILQTTK